MASHSGTSDLSSRLRRPYYCSLLTGRQGRPIILLNKRTLRSHLHASISALHSPSQKRLLPHLRFRFSRTLCHKLCIPANLFPLPSELTWPARLLFSSSPSCIVYRVLVSTSFLSAHQLPFPPAIHHQHHQHHHGRQEYSDSLLRYLCGRFVIPMQGSSIL